MLLFLVSKVATMNCLASSPLPVPHERYQSGGLLIGGIVSQIIYFFPKVSFKEHPSKELDFNIPV